MPRKTEEWIGKSDDHRPPEKVRLRVWKRDGECCKGCGRPLAIGEPFDTDHIKPIILGGENRETNLQTLGRKCCSTHKEKTREEVKEKSRSDRKLKHLLGIKPPSRNPVPGGKNTRYAKKYRRETGRFETWDRAKRDWVSKAGRAA